LGDLKMTAYTATMTKKNEQSKFYQDPDIKKLKAQIKKEGGPGWMVVIKNKSGEEDCRYSTERRAWNG